MWFGGERPASTEGPPASMRATSMARRAETPGVIAGAGGVSEATAEAPAGADFTVAPAGAMAVAAVLSDRSLLA